MRYFSIQFSLILLCFFVFCIGDNTARAKSNHTRNIKIIRDSSPIKNQINQDHTIYEIYDNFDLGCKHSIISCNKKVERGGISYYVSKGITLNSEQSIITQLPARKRFILLLIEWACMILL